MKTPGHNERRSLALKALEAVRRNPVALLALARGVMSAPQTDTSATLLIYGPIGEGLGETGVTAARVASELASVKASRLDVFINSPGGDVFEGLAIHAQLKRFAAAGHEVIVHVDGLAASAASFVAMAGTTVLTAPNAMWMVHRASAATFAAGNAGDMHQHAEDASELAALLEKIDRDIAEMYAARSETDVDGWLELMTAETWLTADEALELGLTDEIETFAEPSSTPASETAPGAIGPRTGHFTQHQHPQGTIMTTRTQPQITNAATQPPPPAPDFSARASEICDVAVPADAPHGDGRRYFSVVRDALERGEPLPRFEDTLARRQTSPGRITGSGKAREYDNGFKSQADFLGAVRATAMGAVDPRLAVKNATSTFGSESVNADGGFAVPTEMHQEILSLIEGDDSLLALTMRVKTGSNRLQVPLDAVLPHDDTQGIRATWEAEGAAITPTKPKLGMLDVKLNRLSTLIPLSDELLEDGVGIASWLPRKVGQLFTARINAAIVSGNGVGRPMGLLESPALVTIAKESGQAAATINLQNVLKMWSALPAASQKRMVWIATPSAILQLGQLTLTGGASPNLFWPQGVLGAPGNTLLGRPLVMSEAASVLGTVGDLIAWDPSTYLVAEKASGVRADTSIHCYFDQFTTAFRFSVRIGGACTWAAPVTRGDLVNTMSPIVALATRS